MLCQQSVEVIRTPLNQSGYADYMWSEWDNINTQVERKQCGELLSDMDGCEMQLRRYYQNGARLYLLVEGVMEPTPFGVACYVKSEGKPYYRVQHSFGTHKHPQTGLFAKYQGWRWSLDKIGVGVIETSSYEATARALVSFYQNSQKAEHRTLRRYIKPHVTIPSLNSHVETLMGIKGAELGEARAVALIDRFETVWGVLNAPPEEIAETEVSGRRLGLTIAQKIRTAIGR